MAHTANTPPYIHAYLISKVNVQYSKKVNWKKWGLGMVRRQHCAA